WALPDADTPALAALKRRYLRTFETGVLALLDARRNALAADLPADDPRRGDLLLGLVRETNLMNARLANDPAAPADMLPELPADYLALLEAEFGGEAAAEFHATYLAWLAWQP